MGPSACSRTSVTVSSTTPCRMVRGRAWRGAFLALVARRSRVVPSLLSSTWTRGFESAPFSSIPVALITTFACNGACSMFDRLSDRSWVRRLGVLGQIVCSSQCRHFIVPVLGQFHVKRDRVIEQGDDVTKGTHHEVSSHFRWHQEHEHPRRARRPLGQTD